MRESLLSMLRCPVDQAVLELRDGVPGTDGHVMEGRLICSLCSAVYEVRRGVPDMLPPNKACVDGEDLDRLQLATISRFGFEWQHYRDWGWLESYPPVPEAEEKYYGGLLEHSRLTFWGKSLFQSQDLRPGLRVLDGGCGNGRFAWQAAQTGAEVIGIDLGQGVYSAFEHTRELSHVHIVRGDLFRLPFEDACFDRIFSIGVLMHTGNAEKAFESLARTLKPNGLIVAHVYGRGRATYELLDRAIRVATTRLPIAAQIRFARGCALLTRKLKQNPPRYWRIFSHVNLLPTEHHMFDWWSAPVASHHTLAEVMDWFTRRGMRVIKTNPPAGDAAAERARRYGHGAVTVLGQRGPSV